MNTRELIHMLAANSDVAPGPAADKLDTAVARILKRLRHGNAVALPGIGVLRLDRGTGIELRQEVIKPVKRKGAR